MTAWKDLERRVCAALGGRRGGNTGQPHSDCVGVPYAVEVKRSSRPGPPVLSNWIVQARHQGRIEGKPWLVVVAGHNDRRPVACLDFAELVRLVHSAHARQEPGTAALGVREDGRRLGEAPPLRQQGQAAQEGA